MSPSKQNLADRIASLELDAVRVASRTRGLMQRVDRLETVAGSARCSLHSEIQGIRARYAILDDRVEELEAAPVRRKLRNRLARLLQRLAVKLMVMR